MRLNEFVKYLGLTRPYKIEIKSRKHKSMDAGYIALYSDGGKGTLHSHLIRVYAGNIRRNNSRNLETIIAHELIHAWQEEMSIDEIHGPMFIKMAKSMDTIFDLPNIYMPDIDTP